MVLFQQLYNDKFILLMSKKFNINSQMGGGYTKYNKPSLSIIQFDFQDIITESRTCFGEDCVAVDTFNGTCGVNCEGVNEE